MATTFTSSGLVSPHDLAAARERLAAKTAAAASQSNRNRSTSMARNDAAAARANERERINAIMSHEAAASKSNLARYLALETDHDVELCLGILAVAASEASARPSQQATPFASYMDASTHPNVGAGPGDVGFHDEVIGSLVNMGLVSHASADQASAETVALARRMGLKGFAKED